MSCISRVFLHDVSMASGKVPRSQACSLTVLSELHHWSFVQAVFVMKTFSGRDRFLVLLAMFGKLGWRERRRTWCLKVEAHWGIMAGEIV